MPHFYEVSWETANYSHSKPDVMIAFGSESKSSPQLRYNELREKLFEIVMKAHAKFLRENPDLGSFDPIKMNAWHCLFEIHEVPQI